MPKGYSLHVGVNKASPRFPSPATLYGCENDAYAMERIAEQAHFSKRKVLLGPNATYVNVENEIRAAAEGADALVKDDIFLFTFAGHGASVPEDDGDGDEKDDEMIQLYDYMLFDDVLRLELWPLFAKGVRVIMVSDSCHSGTVSSFLSFAAGAPTGFRKAERLSIGDFEVSTTTEVTPVVSRPRVRELPDDALYHHLWRHRNFYEKVFAGLPAPKDARPIGACVLLLAACHDDEDAVEAPVTPTHGVFTRSLVEVWDGGAFKGNHDQFKDAVAANIRSGKGQNPQLTSIGEPNAAFHAQRPFTVPFP